MNLEETKQHIAAAHQMVSDLCHQRREWIMSIPADPERDPDLVIGQALRDADGLAKEVERLQRELDALKAPTPPAVLPGFMPTILYSLDRKLYYIDQPGRLSYHWLSVDTIPGSVPDDKKNGMLDGYVQFTRGDGRVYHRRALPFAFYEVRAERDPEPVDLTGDLYLDYVALEWPTLGAEQRFTVIVNGQRRSVVVSAITLVGSFIAQLLEKFEPGEKVDGWDLTDERGTLLAKDQPLGQRSGQTLFLNLKPGVGA